MTEAKPALAELVAEGLPEWPNSMMSIQVVNSIHTQIVELRLAFQIIHP